MAPTSVAKEFSSIECKERSGVFQHPDCLFVTHVVEVCVAAYIYEEFLQHWQGDTINLLKWGPAYQRLDNQSGLGDIDIVIENLFVGAVEYAPSFLLESMEEDFCQFPLSLNICECVVG